MFSFELPVISEFYYRINVSDHIFISSSLPKLMDIFTECYVLWFVLCRAAVKDPSGSHVHFSIKWVSEK